MILEVLEHGLTGLGQQRAGSSAALTSRVRTAIEAGQIVLHDDPFWSTWLSYHQLPPRTISELSGADLIVFKGDVNYRRLLDDRHWPLTAHLAEIIVNGRSMFEVLYLASTFVHVPEEYVARVRPRETLDVEWLVISVSSTRPSNAWLSVCYDGYWYYIASNDLNSRVSFTLIEAMFASVVGNVPGAKPLLTLPVR